MSIIYSANQMDPTDSDAHPTSCSCKEGTSEESKVRERGQSYREGQDLENQEQEMSYKHRNSASQRFVATSRGNPQSSTTPTQRTLREL